MSTIIAIRGKGWDESKPIAGFDMDSTLIRTKSGRKFARDSSDWKWMRSEIPQRLAGIATAGHSLAIITNQKGKSEEHVRKMAAEILAEIRAPVFFIAALAGDRWRKPCPDSWNEHFGRAPKADSYYVGDAAGRPGDHADSDRKYAMNVGVRFMTPEEWLDGIAPKLPRLQNSLAAIPSRPLPLPRHKLVVLVGVQGCGKSTYAAELEGYHVVNRDTVGTIARCEKLVRQKLEEGERVVVDNTNPDKNSRARWLAISSDLRCKTSCVWFDLPPEVAEHMRKIRTWNGGTPIPAVAVSVYNKKFERPEAEEGFAEVIRIRKPCYKFATDAQRSRFNLYT